MSYRTAEKVIQGMPASDGDGVRMTRVIGSPALNTLDPFLLLDHFGSDHPQDYIGGFPPHPHRGFETVTYMLHGKMRHKDSAGNEGVIEDGGVQWMTAGKGIIHSEMPEQTEGLLSGFQLWVNLPAAQKMTPPKYQEKVADQIATELREDGTQIKVIAGQTSQGTTGVIDNQWIRPNYWHVKLPTGNLIDESITSSHNGFVYVFQGSVALQGDKESININRGKLAVLSKGKGIKLFANEDSEFIIVTGEPLNEPIERAGPFVMNTKAEIYQAFEDYQRGRLV